MALKEQPSRSNKPAEWSPYDDRQADQPISDVDAFLFPYEERPAAPTSSAFPSASSLAIKKYANAPQLVNSRQARDWYYRAARNGATSYKEQPSKLSNRVWLDLVSVRMEIVSVRMEIVSVQMDSVHT